MTSQEHNPHRLLPFPAPAPDVAKVAADEHGGRGATEEPSPEPEPIRQVKALRATDDRGWASDLEDADAIPDDADPVDPVDQDRNGRKPLPHSFGCTSSPWRTTRPVASSTTPTSRSTETTGA